MKRFLRLVFISSLLIELEACNRDPGIAPTGPLYRTWRLVETRSGNDAPQAIASSRRITIAFLPDGRILYDQNGYDGACCVPRRFEQKGQILRVDNSADQPEYCKYVDIACTTEYAYSSSGWVITDLTDSQLVLQLADKLLTHQPVR